MYEYVLPCVVFCCMFCCAFCGVFCYVFCYVFCHVLCSAVRRCKIAIYPSMNLASVPQWLLLRLLALLDGDLDSCWNLIYAIDGNYYDDAVCRYLIE